MGRYGDTGCRRRQEPSTRPILYVPRTSGHRAARRRPLRPHDREPFRVGYAVLPKAGRRQPGVHAQARRRRTTPRWHRVKLWRVSCSFFPPARLLGTSAADRAATGYVRFVGPAARWNNCGLAGGMRSPRRFAPFRAESAHSASWSVGGKDSRGRGFLLASPSEARDDQPQNCGRTNGSPSEEADDTAHLG
jgi:hypothetical protein